MSAPLAQLPLPAFDGTQACAGRDLAVFFPRQGESSRSIPYAKAICARCRFRVPCREYAVTARAAGVFVDGVWGGTTGDERLAIRRSRKRAAA